MYAVDGGDYGGSYFVVCENNNTHIDCVQLPDKNIVRVPLKSFNVGLSGNLLKHVAILPEGVYAYCKEIYEKHKNTNI
jgi:hypothetical protein